VTLPRCDRLVAVLALASGIAAGYHLLRQDSQSGKSDRVVGAEIAPMSTGPAQWDTTSNALITEIQWGTKSCTGSGDQGIPEDA
jgi:hypothetical protein